MIVRENLCIGDSVVLTVADDGEEGRGEEDHHLGDAVHRVGGVDVLEANEGQRDAEAFEEEVRDETGEAEEGVDFLAGDLRAWYEESVFLVRAS